MTTFLQSQVSLLRPLGIEIGSLISTSNSCFLCNWVFTIKTSL